jgi:transposase
VQEPAPHRPVDKGLTGPGLLSHVLVAKYADHLSLYRQSEIYAREGVELERSTMADWVGGAGRTLLPDGSAEELRAQTEKLHGDDVPVPVLEPDNGKTKTDRLWTYVRDDHPAGSEAPSAVWFAYSLDRRGERPAGHLQNYRGVLQADRYAGFNKLYERGTIVEAACWGSCKKKVLRVAPPACFAGGERGARTHRAVVWGREGDQRTIASGAQGSPTSRIEAGAGGHACVAEGAMSKLPKKSELAKAIYYALERWTAFMVFVDDGLVDGQQRGCARVAHSRYREEELSARQFRRRRRTCGGDL